MGDGKEIADYESVMQRVWPLPMAYGMSAAWECVVSIDIAQDLFGFDCLRLNAPSKSDKRCSAVVRPIGLAAGAVPDEFLDPLAAIRRRAP